MRVFCILLVLFAISGVYPAVFSEEPSTEAKPVSYFKDVLPILRQKNCTGCHQPAKRGGEYDMTNFAALLKGGESGEAAIVSGKPDKSYLIGQITPSGGKADMPKDASPLTDAEISTIRKWIEQ